MDDHQVETDATSRPFEADRCLTAPRRQIEERLAQQSVQLNQLEDRIADQIRHLTDEIAREHRQSHDASDQHPEQQRGGNDEGARLTALLEEISQRESRWQQLQDQVAKEQSAREHKLLEREQGLTSQQEQFERVQLEYRESQHRLATLEDDLNLLRQRLDRREEHLEHDEELVRIERSRLAEQAAETKSQRRRIAKAFQSQRAAQLADLARRRAELERTNSADHSELQQQLQTAVTEAESLRKQNAQLRKALNVRARKLNEFRERVAELTAELEEARNAHDKVSQELAVHHVVTTGHHEEVESLKTERDQLARQLADAGRTSQPIASDEDQHKRDELQRRLAMAIEDVRELKRRNADLESKLDQVRPSTVEKGSGKVDWETQKKRLLAALEGDAVGRDPLPEQDRLTIEGTIRITDDMVAEKDREIARLRAESQNRHDVAEQAEAQSEAVVELLDADKIIRSEREKLQQLQEEWREKLRSAEIDLSVERAKIARGHAQIEEKLQAYRAEQARREPSEANEGDRSAQRPTRRWLTRLGLKDTDP